MSHDEGWNAPAGAAIIAVDVRAADAAGFDVDEDVVRSDGWLGDVAELEIARIFENKSFHYVKDNL